MGDRLRRHRRRRRGQMSAVGEGHDLTVDLKTMERVFGGASSKCTWLIPGTVGPPIMSQLPHNVCDQSVKTLTSKRAFIDNCL